MATSRTGLGESVRSPDFVAWSWLAVLAAVALSTALLYGERLAVVVGHFTQPEFSHGYVIPLIAAFFLWHRRRAVLAEREGGSWWGVAVAALALALYVVGVLAFIVRLPAISFVLLLLGLGYAALGARAMRRAWLPILFMLTAVPLPGLVFVAVSTELQLVSSQLGAAMLEAVGIPVFLSGNIIDLGIYKLQVAEACSGLRYLLPLATFAFLCAWLMRAPLWVRGIVLLSAVPLTIVLNSVRIALTGVIVQHGGVRMAEGFMHMFEGWVVFLVALALLFVLMWLLCRLRGERIGPLDVLDFDRIDGPPARPNPAGAPAHPPLPLLVTAGLLALTLALQPLWRDRHQYIPDRPGLASFPLQLGPWRAIPERLDPATTETLKTSDYLLADYTASERPAVNLWIAYYDSQVADAAIHSPKECLPGAGWEYVSLEPVAAPVAPGTAEPFQLNRAVIAKGSRTMIMYYWLDMRGRKITNDILMKVYNLYDSVVRGRSDGALIRMYTAVAACESEA
jgi:exosortase D (VPLPA-CTERM-specific)